MSVRYKAIVEYDGGAYQGYQRQEDHIATVQGEIEAVIAEIARQHVTVYASGRTDAGVHAVGQVIAFDMAWKYGANALHRAINRKLPMDISFLSLGEVDNEFHPRFSAKRRGYRYTVYNGVERRPLLRHQTWHVKDRLDAAVMNEAAHYLIGHHDFGTFGTPPIGTNSVRDIFHAQWERDGEFLYFDIVATAFLRRMVRGIVGSLALVGKGSWSVEQFRAAMAACERSRTGASAPPQGLVLQFVEY